MTYAAAGMERAPRLWGEGNTLQIYPGGRTRSQAGTAGVIQDDSKAVGGRRGPCLGWGDGAGEKGRQLESCAAHTVAGGPGKGLC